MNVVVENTRFAPPPARPIHGNRGHGQQDRQKGDSSGAGSDGCRSGSIRQRITARFERYHKLTEGEIGKTPIDRLIEVKATELRGSTPGR